MKYKQGNIVFIPYPYTDLSATKKRPVVIISKDSINRHNYIVAKITSVIRADKFSFPIEQSDVDIPLKLKSEVRTDEVTTIHQSIVVTKFSTLKKSALKQLTERIKQNISVE